MKKHLYYVRLRDADDGEEMFKFANADEIFNMMDMNDCHPREIEIFRINGFGEGLTECSFRGTWHDVNDPLMMCIEGGGIKEIGYGTDH